MTHDGGLGADQILGKRGSDTVSYGNRTEPVTVGIASDDDAQLAGFIPDGAAGERDNDEVENAIGGSGNDLFIGGKPSVGPLLADFKDTFTGGAGNDVMMGLAGNDHLLGQAGNDKLVGGAQKDTLTGGSGRDRCVGGGSKDRAKGCERKKTI